MVVAGIPAIAAITATSAAAGGAFNAAAASTLATTGSAPGVCPTDSGVTAVVDFTALDQPNDGRPDFGTVVRCVTGSPKTGTDVLQQAGFDPTGTAQYGLAFVCRLAGRPASNEPLPVDGDPGYTEACQQTPPQTAYWGYFTAPNGGQWNFSSTGASSRHPVTGGFEGWSFQLNDAVPVPPGLAPRRPEASPSPTQPPASAPSSAQSSSTSQPPTTAPSSASSPPISASSQPSPLTPGGVEMTTLLSRVHGSGSGVPGRQPVLHQRSAPRLASEQQRSSTGSAADVPTSRATAPPAGSSRATFFSLGVVGVLGAAAGITAWRRSRRT